MNNAWGGIADHVGHGLIQESEKNDLTVSKVTVGGVKLKTVLSCVNSAENKLFSI